MAHKSSLTVWTDQDVKIAADAPGHLRVIWARSVLDDFIRETGSPGQQRGLQDLWQIFHVGCRKASDCVFLSGTLRTSSEAWTTSSKHGTDMAKSECGAEMHTHYHNGLKRRQKSMFNAPTTLHCGICYQEWGAIRWIGMFLDKNDKDSSWLWALVLIH